MNPPDEVVVHGTLTGFKVANLIIDGDGAPGFEGAGLGGVYGPVDVAVCVSWPQHVPPQPGCQCGFYAWRTRSWAAELVTAHRVALLEVGLWGRFHEYQHGYIAAAQQVRRVTLAPWCTSCLTGQGRTVTAAAVLGTGSHVRDGRLVPFCDLHAGDAMRTLAPEGLADRLALPVVWAAADDQVAAAQKVPRFDVVPRPRTFRRLAALAPGESGHVFRNAISQDHHGHVFLDPAARLIQPLPTTDVPVRRTSHGRYEIVLERLTGLEGWQPRDPARFTLPATTVGTPAPVTDADQHPTQDRAA